MERHIQKYIPAFRACGFLLSYSLWIALFKLLFLTLITYFLISSSHGREHLDEVNEAFWASEITVMALGAFLYAGMLRWLNPLTATEAREIFAPGRLRGWFLPGLLHGAMLAGGVTAAFVFSGVYRYLGAFIQVEDLPLALASVLFRVAALLGLAYFEEFIFRRKILKHWREFMEPRGARGGEHAAVLLTAAFFCAAKSLQFDLGLMQLLTLFLLSIDLGYKALQDGDFGRAAGIWAGILIVFQAVFSLPVLGTDFSGVILLKYQATSAPGRIPHFLTGGPGGPLSSVAFQILLLVDILRSAGKFKKTLLFTRAQTIQ